jgi:hypothetical protein
MTNWSSIEDLNKLQIDLVKNYGAEEETVSTLISKIKEATNATSSFYYQLDKFGKYAQSVEKANNALYRQTGLQWEYE